MALITAPTYSTHAEFLIYTPRQSQKAGGSNEVAEVIWLHYALQAQFMIDDHVSKTVPPYESTQDSVFPTIGGDGESWLPDEIKRAHIYLTSWLAAKGEIGTETKDVAGESYSGTGYSKTFASSSSAKSATKVDMPADVANILAPWGAKAAPATY